VCSSDLTLKTSYRFSLEKADRVAGRSAHVVSVQPLNADRYAYRLWIDEEFKLLLKSVILDRSGQPLEQVQFTAIAVLDDVPEHLLQPEITGSGFTWRTDDENEAPSVADAQQLNWDVNWLPVGFTMKENKVQSMVTSDMPVNQLVYSDGLAMVSVFVEKLMPDASPLQGYSARGAGNAFTRVSDNHQIPVVGELPLPTVRQIATAVFRTKH